MTPNTIIVDEAAKHGANVGPRSFTLGLWIGLLMASSDPRFSIHDEQFLRWIVRTTIELVPNRRCR